MTKNNTTQKLATLARIIARSGSLLISLSMFGFSLISGAGELENSSSALLYNSLNALPWATLLLLNFIAWKNELIGGFMIIAFSIIATAFFNFSGPLFYLEVFLITISIGVFGVLFTISWYLRKSKINF